MTGNLDQRIDTLLAHFLPQIEQRAMFWQVVRFGISGVGLTLLVLVLAWAAEHSLHAGPNRAFAMAYVVGVIAGYVVHSQWSFRGHGGRDQAHLRIIQFVIINLVGFGLNQFFVWLVRHFWGLTFWVEALPILFVTPMITFWLNRKWVFA